MLLMGAGNYGPPAMRARANCLLLCDDPNVAIDDRIPVILQLNRSSPWAVFLSRGRRGAVDLRILMHQDAVMPDGDLRIRRLLAFGIVAGGRVVDVVGLPAQGRIAHVHSGFMFRIDGAAFVVFSFEPE